MFTHNKKSKQTFFELKSYFFDLEEEWLKIKSEIANSKSPSKKEQIAKSFLYKIVSLIKTKEINSLDSSHRKECLIICENLSLILNKKDKSFELLKILYLLLNNLEYNPDFLEAWIKYKQNNLSNLHFILALPNLHLIAENIYEQPVLLVNTLLAVLWNFKLQFPKEKMLENARCSSYFPLSLLIHHTSTITDLKTIIALLQQKEFYFLGKKQNSSVWFFLIMETKKQLLKIDSHYPLKNFEREFILDNADNDDPLQVDLKASATPQLLHP